MKDLIAELKEDGQDHEFYPTSSEIVAVLFEALLDVNCHDSKGLLDIGAGNGILFKQLRECTAKALEKDEYGSFHSFSDAYAIEKSPILISQMEPDVFVLGTDFRKQTLIDKKIFNTFCNPPYSDFEAWSARIIRETKSSYVFLVIPERWVDSAPIMNALKIREAKHTILGSFSFEDSEFRKARAKVNLIKIDMTAGYYSRDPKNDPFSIWYEDNFKSEEVELDDKPKDAGTKSGLHSLVKGQNLIERLSELYLGELNKIQETFTKINSLDSEMLRNLGVDSSVVMGSLKSKYKGLKNLYWSELFTSLDKLTERLASKTREKMLGRLTGNTSVDFTRDNAYAVVMWAIKNANKYIDEQMVEVFKWMSSPEHVKNYKSNKHFIEDSWRFGQEASHYSLDYRIVTDCNMFIDSWRDPSGRQKFNDLCIVARNLGFRIVEDALTIEFGRGKSLDLHYMENGEEKLFCKCRFYQNGNGHFKFDQKFMLKLNIEAGRVLGWINTPKQASEEMGLPEEEVAEFFNSNLQLTPSSVKLIGN